MNHDLARFADGGALGGDPDHALVETDSVGLESVDFGAGHAWANAGEQAQRVVRDSDAALVPLHELAGLGVGERWCRAAALSKAVLRNPQDGVLGDPAAEECELEERGDGVAAVAVGRE